MRGKEYANRMHSFNPKFQYVPVQDRFLMAQSEAVLRFNVIGVGVNGQQHIKVTLLEGSCDILGVYDPNPTSILAAQKIRSKYSSVPLVVYQSIQQACKDDRIDGVIISTPNFTHLNVLREAVKYDKHILLQKPMATNLDDAYQICQLASNHSKTVQIGLQYRFKPIYVEAVHQALQRKSLGDIKTITIMQHRQPFLDKVKQWNKFSQFSGGTLVEKCCHYFDLFNLFAKSKPKSVYATGSQSVNFKSFQYQGKKSDIIDNAFVIVEYQNGIKANFNLCMFSPMVYEQLVICGEEGRLKASQGSNSQAHSEWKNYLQVISLPHKTSRIMTPTYPTYIQQTGHNGGTYFQHLNWIKSIQGKSHQGAQFKEGFWSIVIGYAGELSIKRGEKVMISQLLSKYDLSLVQ